MKVHELISKLLKCPAGCDVELNFNDRTKQKIIEAAEDGSDALAELLDVITVTGVSKKEADLGFIELFTRCNDETLI